MGKFDQPDPFSVTPLFAVVPPRGDTLRLMSLERGFFARQERLEQQPAGASSAERAMLRETLLWIEERQQKEQR